MSASDETATAVEPPSIIDPVETLPLPADRARRGLPISVVFSEITAWPGQRLRVELEWNPFSDRWSFDVYHVNQGDDHLISGRATLGYAYIDPMPYCLLVFRTPDDTITGVTRETLPNIDLAIYPGPEGGDFLPDAGISDAEAAALFNLQQPDPEAQITEPLEFDDELPDDF